MRNANILIFLCFFFLIGFSGFIQGKEQTLTFVIFGDCHISDKDNPDSTILKKIIQKIGQKTPEAQFAINLGDIVAVEKNPIIYEKALENYFTLIKDLKIPIYHIPGNHDMVNDKKIQEIYKKNMGPLYYAIEKENMLLVFLNSERLDKVQIQWLNDILNGSFKTKMVFIHRPVYPVYPVYYDISDIKNFALLRQILNEKNVTEIFSGHEHIFYTQKNGKILQVISGGAGGRLIPAPLAGKSIFHYCAVYVNNGQVSVKAIPIDDNEIK
ncbi:MAG TPA: metallophosphoesterase [bacterium]|nr:metallophosphoesterase [bacterium]